MDHYKFTVGIDIGTGSTKAVVLDADHKPLGAFQRHYSIRSPFPGSSEQDPEEIWQAFTGCLWDLSQQYPYTPLCIGLSSAMHSLIPVDATGNALAPMMTWADTRSAEIAARLLSTEEGMDLYRSTGMPIHAMNPLCKILWIREHEPGCFAKTYKFISIKEYIWYRLFGEYAIDHSLAAAMGFLDHQTFRWNASALKCAGITTGQLSVPVPTSYSRREHQATVLPECFRQSPFVIGASDGCLANLGTGAWHAGDAALTIGTSGAIRVARTAPLFNKAMPFSYPLDERTIICGGPTNNGGIALRWLLSEVLGKQEEPTEAEYAQCFAAAQEIPPGSEGLWFLPYLNGERSPIWDAGSCGNFFGLRLRHRKAHFYRSVLEGICYSMKDVLDSLEQSGLKIEAIHISGGFVRAEVWIQMLADISGKTLLLSETADASAIGAAYLALKSLGFENEYPGAGVSRRIQPNMQHHQKYQEYFKVYKSLYTQLKDVMHEIKNIL